MASETDSFRALPTLEIAIISHGDEPVECNKKNLSQGQITIGRGSDNDWTLPDPDRVMSKSHCIIENKENVFYIIDTSLNGIFINNSEIPLGKNQRAEILDGDTFSIGNYSFSVKIHKNLHEVQSQGINQSINSYGEARPISAETPEKVDPFDIGAPTANNSVNEKMDPFRFATSPSTSDQNQSFEDPALSNKEEIEKYLKNDSDHKLIPEGTDIFGLDSHDNNFFQESKEPLLDIQKDNMPQWNDQFSVPGVAPDKIPDNWASDDPIEDNQPSEPAFPLEDQREQEAVEYMPPPNTDLGSVAAQEQPEDSAQSSAASALLNAAGLADMEHLIDDETLFMERVGRVIRAMTAGLREALAARAAIKNEFRVERTIIQAARNNPLKFSASETDTLKALIQPPQSGYLSAEESVEQGFNDLKAHEIALMAAMQATLSSIIEQFNPENLKKRLEEKSSFSSILPGAKSKKYWESYEQLFKEIAQDVEGNVGSNFKNEFAQSYEAQIRKL